MSSLDNIYQKMVPTLEPATLAHLHHEPARPEPQAQMAREVAHELNNILTIIQGYADRMIMKNAENPVLSPDLKTISNNARRAVTLIREARRLTAAKSLS